MVDITVVGNDARKVADADATAGMIREAAIVGDNVWAGVVRAAPNRPSGWHHHGEYDTYIYVRSGSVHFDFGPDGTRTVDAADGDFIHVPKGVVHREVNPADDEATVVLIRVGEGPPVVNVDGPA